MTYQARWMSSLGVSDVTPRSSYRSCVVAYSLAYNRRSDLSIVVILPLLFPGLEGG